MRKNIKNPNPSPATRWKKGQSGNPKGTVPLAPELKRILKLTANEVKEIIGVLLYATESEVLAIHKDPAAPYLRKIIASVLVNAHQTGNMSQLDGVLNRCIGKVKDDVDITVLKPSILVRKNGEEVVFTSEPLKDEEE